MSTTPHRAVVVGVDGSPTAALAVAGPRKPPKVMTRHCGRSPHTAIVPSPSRAPRPLAC